MNEHLEDKMRKVQSNKKILSAVFFIILIAKSSYANHVSYTLMKEFTQSCLSIFSLNKPKNCRTHKVDLPSNEKINFSQKAFDEVSDYTFINGTWDPFKDKDMKSRSILLAELDWNRMLALTITSRDTVSNCIELENHLHENYHFYGAISDTIHTQVNRTSHIYYLSHKNDHKDVYKLSCHDQDN